jgi:Family of unknown function (DUF5670)
MRPVIRTIFVIPTQRSIENLLNSYLNLMLVTIAIILLVLWLLGIVTSYTIGGFIYILLVAAIILFLIRIIQGKNPVQ